MLTKQGEFTKKVTDLPDQPSPDYTATDIKMYFQTPSDELKATHNKLVDELVASTGAGEIGAKKPDGTSSTVQAELDNRYTKTQIDAKITVLHETDNDLSRRVDNIVASAGNSNTEIVDARDDSVNNKTYATLKARLDDTSAQLADIVINVKTLGADDTGVNNSEAAFRSALAAIAAAGGGTVKIPSGAYKLDLSETLQIPANCTIESSGVLNLISDDVIGFTASNVSNVHFYGGRINGSGVAGSAWAVYFDTCSDCSMEQVTIRDASSSAVRVGDCTNFTMENCDIQESYFYSVSDTGSTNSRYTRNVFSNNGYGDSTGGRGINVWRVNGCEISYNSVAGNNEYGIRVYTETGDLQPTKKILIVGNECTDNALIDIYVYAESDPRDVLISNNIIEQTTDSSANGIAIGGDGVVALNNTIRKPGTTPSGSAISFFSATKCSAKSNQIFGYFTAFNMSSTEKPESCVIESNEAYDVKDFVPMYGAKNIVRNNIAYHKGSAVSGEVGYHQVDNSTGCVVDGNTFVGFHSGVLLDFNVDIVLKNNVVRDSVHSNIRSGLTNFHSMTIIGNDWANFASAEILRSLEVRNGRYTFTATDIPSTGMSSYTFAVGDRAFVRTPAAAGNLDWVCTTAGTPGTWKTSSTIAP